MTIAASIRTLGLAVLLAAPALPAFAQATPAAPAISIDDARRIATQQGIAKIEEIELDDGKWEVEGRDSGGYEIEVDIRASDGLILKIERDRRSPIRP